MIEILKLLVDFMNNFHHKAVEILGPSGYGFTDKQLHFIFIGALGIMIFIFSHFLIKVIAKYSITAVSFIYTFTILIFITVAIEIQQKITGQGNAEFGDVFWGLYGFVFVFCVYIAIRLIFWSIKWGVSKYREKHKPAKRAAKKRARPKDNWDD